MEAYYHRFTELLVRERYFQTSPEALSEKIFDVLFWYHQSLKIHFRLHYHTKIRRFFPKIAKVISQKVPYKRPYPDGL